MSEPLKIMSYSGKRYTMSIMYWPAIGLYTGVLYFTQENFISHEHDTLIGVIKRLSYGANSISNDIGVKAFFN